MRRSRILLVAALLASPLASPARAGMFEGVLDTLRFAGFAVDSTHFELTNTSVATVASVLQGNTIDLGDFDFALAGPVSAVVETGGRRIPEIGLTLSTGLFNLNPNRVVTVGPPQPLLYTLNFDSGTNDTTVSGNLLFDLRAKINTFGSYDLQFQTSNRETTTIDGRFEDFPIGDADFDIGPIDIEGNIFADILATLTDPFFDAAGLENIFAEFSGRTFREQESLKTIDGLRAKIDAGGTLSGDELATVAAMQFMSNILGDELPSLSFLERGLLESGQALDGVNSVPEPTSGLLLAAGSLALLRRRR